MHLDLPVPDLPPLGPPPDRLLPLEELAWRAVAASAPGLRRPARLAVEVTAVALAGVWRIGRADPELMGYLATFLDDLQVPDDARPALMAGPRAVRLDG